MLESEKIFYTFGKYKGKSLKEVFNYDESYFSWSYYASPQFKEMISGCSSDFIQCVKITAYNYRVKRHNKMLMRCMQPLDKYIKNPNFFKYFKEEKIEKTDYYSYDDNLIDEEDNTFHQEDNDMNNNF